MTPAQHDHKQAERRFRWRAVQVLFALIMLAAAPFIASMGGREGF